MIIIEDNIFTNNLANIGPSIRIILHHGYEKDMNTIF